MAGSVARSASALGWSVCEKQIHRRGLVRRASTTAKLPTRNQERETDPTDVFRKNPIALQQLRMLHMQGNLEHTKLFSEFLTKELYSRAIAYRTRLRQKMETVQEELPVGITRLFENYSLCMDEILRGPKLENQPASIELLNENQHFLWEGVRNVEWAIGLSALKDVQAWLAEQPPEELERWHGPLDVVMDDAHDFVIAGRAVLRQIDATLYKIQEDSGQLPDSKTNYTASDAGCPFPDATSSSAAAGQKAKSSSVQSCSMREVAERAIERAKITMIDKAGGSPPVVMEGNWDVRAMTMPNVLDFIIYEIVKNSIQATFDHVGVAQSEDGEPIVVFCTSTKGEVGIRVSDRGGGIPRAILPRVFSYLFSTAYRREQSWKFSADYGAPAAGFGVGLPLARRYANALGGDLQLCSLRGWGTDIVFHVSRVDGAL